MFKQKLQLCCVMDCNWESPEVCALYSSCASRVQYMLVCAYSLFFLLPQYLCLIIVMYVVVYAQADKIGNELKRSTLLELAEYITSAGGQKILTDAMLEDVVTMVQVG